MSKCLKAVLIAAHQHYNVWYYYLLSYLKAPGSGLSCVGLKLSRLLAGCFAD